MGTKRSKPSIAADASKEAIGARLKHAREAVGLTQRELARRAKIAANTYNQWEKGAQMPEVEFAIALCEAHKWTLDYIYRGEMDNMPTKVWKHTQKQPS